MAFPSFCLLTGLSLVTVLTLAAARFALRDAAAMAAAQLEITGRRGLFYCGDRVQFVFGERADVAGFAPRRCRVRVWT